VTLARTETIRAASMGHQRLWRQATDAGLIRCAGTGQPHARRALLVVLLAQKYGPLRCFPNVAVAVRPSLPAREKHSNMNLLAKVVIGGVADADTTKKPAPARRHMPSRLLSTRASSRLPSVQQKMETS
jgi:hypothetical protein